MITCLLIRGHQLYVAALYEAHEPIEDALASLPADLRGRAHVATRVDLTWPCYLVEDRAGIALATRAEAEHAIVRADQAGLLDDENRAINVYCIAEPFGPSSDGRDAMGALDHHHFTRTDARRVAEEGLDWWWPATSQVDEANSGMEHGDFHLGMTFYTATGAWRCTDIGSRVIVAIKLPSNADAVIDGPPFAEAEIVFDEYDIEGCSLVADEPDAKPPSGP